MGPGASLCGGCFSWKREAAKAGSAVTPGLENTAGGTPHTATPHSTALGAGIKGMEENRSTREH